MAIVAVGDFDPDRMEQKIRQAFGDVPAPKEPLVRPTFDLPPHAETLVTIATDTEARFSMAQVYFKRPHEPVKTLQDYRQSLVDGLLFRMLGQRFQEVSQRADGPFLNASAGGGGLGRSVETFTLFVRTEDGKIAPGLAAAVTELKRAEEHGFGAAELQRARDSFLADLENIWNEKNRTENNQLASEYVSWFLEQEPAPGIEFEYEHARSLVPTITLEEIDAALDRMITPENRVIAVLAPEKEGLEPPAEPAIRSAFDQGWAAAVTPWIDSVADRPFMAEKPKPGTITGRRSIPEIGVTVLTLSNGVDVWLKPTDFKNDEIIFSATSLGGASLADPADYPEAGRAPAMVGEQGVGGFKPAELEKMLAGKLVNGRPYIGNYTHGLGGDCPPRDLETALQLLYLTFTQPTDRPEAFDVLRKRWRNEAENRANDPNAVFSERVARDQQPRSLHGPAADGAGGRRARHAEGGGLLPRALRQRGRLHLLLRRRLRSGHARAAGGAVRRGAPLHRKEDGHLHGPRPPLPRPRRHRGSAQGDGAEEPDAVHLLRRHRPGRDGGLPRPHGGQHLPPAASGNAARGARHHLQRVGGLRQLGTAEGLRNDVGGLQRRSGKGRPDGRHHHGGAPAAPGRRPHRRGTLLTKEQERRELETAEKQNGYWLGSLQTVNVLGYDPVRIAMRRERIEGLTREDLHQAFLKYFPLDRYTKITLLPEAAPDTGQVAPGK